MKRNTIIATVFHGLLKWFNHAFGKAVWGWVVWGYTIVIDTDFIRSAKICRFERNKLGAIVTYHAAVQEAHTLQMCLATLLSHWLMSSQLSLAIYRKRPQISINKRSCEIYINLSPFLRWILIIFLSMQSPTPPRHRWGFVQLKMQKTHLSRHNSPH